jgi:transposase IS116/IS110/IS902 family protein
MRRTAEVLIAEIGVDMNVLPTSKDLASWASVCPGNDESAGKTPLGTTRKGEKWPVSRDSTGPGAHPSGGSVIERARSWPSALTRRRS